MGGRGSSYGGGRVTDSAMRTIASGKYGDKFITTAGGSNEEKLIKGYTKTLFGPLNKDLNSANPSKDGLFLAQQINKALDTQKSFQGVSYRAMGLDESQSRSFINNIRKNKDIKFNSFTSTSKEIHTMFLWGKGKLVLKIHGKNGKDISHFGTAREKEVLFKTGSKFRYVGYKKIIVDKIPGMTPKHIYQVTLKEHGARFYKTKRAPKIVKLPYDPLAESKSLFN